LVIIIHNKCNTTLVAQDHIMFGLFAKNETMSKFMSEEKFSHIRN
jgi:hypothetical protein